MMPPNDDDDDDDGLSKLLRVSQIIKAFQTTKNL